jgi:hypothetical protein
MVMVIVSLLLGQNHRLAVCHEVARRATRRSIGMSTMAGTSEKSAKIKEGSRQAGHRKSRSSSRTAGRATTIVKKRKRGRKQTQCYDSCRLLSWDNIARPKARIERLRAIYRGPNPDVEMQNLRAPAQLAIKGNGGCIRAVGLHEYCAGISCLS